MVRRTASLAQQVTQELLSEIKAGTIARDDGLLPSEAELSQRFGVSRATLREALSRLDLAGVIVRRQGVGTYVNSRSSGNPAVVRGWFDEATALMDFVRDSDSEAQAQVIESRTRPANEVASYLDLEPASSVVAIEKLFLSGAIPVIHCVNIVPVHLIEPGSVEKAAELFGAAESAYQFIEQHCHHRVHHQQSETRAVLADEKLTRLLQCQLGAPLLRVEEVGYNAELLPVFYGLNHFRGDLVAFRQVRHPAVSIGPVFLVTGRGDIA